MTSTIFNPAKREGVNVIASLSGGTGSGKTMSGFEFSSGLAGDKPFAVIDTESKRALHYADRYRFDHAELRPPFRPDAYLQAVIDAEAAGYSVIMIDSGSHMWAGDGGLLDWHDQELEDMVKRKREFFADKGWKFDEYKTREASTFSAWIEPKTSNKRFVQRLLQCRAHVVICLRAEEKIEIVKLNDKGEIDQERGKAKVRPKATPHGRDGWTPICEKNLPYEMTCSFLLKAERPGFPIPIKLQEQHRAMFPLDQPVGRRAGELMAAWAGGATAQAPSPPSEKLAQAQSVIARAKTLGELEAVGKGLADAGLSADELRQAKDAYKARGNKLRSESAKNDAKPGQLPLERREPGQD